jgi:hypothetical protein
MTGLLNLPLEILEQICELIAGSRPSDLKSFSEVSKKCLAASSRSLWRTVWLRTYADSTLEIVDKLKHILQKRLSGNARDAASQSPVVAHRTTVQKWKRPIAQEEEST